MNKDKAENSIVYADTVENFIEHCNHNVISDIVMDMMELNLGISVAGNEKASWAKSLLHVSNKLKLSKLRDKYILIEYRVSVSKQRIDVIIIGEKDGTPAAYILELKQWSKVTEVEWNNFRIAGKYNDTHPVQQAEDYKYKLEHYMGLENKMHIGCGAYLHNMVNQETPLLDEKYSMHIDLDKLFTKYREEHMIREIEEHITSPNYKGAFELLADAEWSPSKTFKEHLTADFNEMKLIGSQQNIYDRVIKMFEKTDHNGKITFIISGDPGSGKTVVAFKIMYKLIIELGMMVKLIIPGEEVRDEFKRSVTHKKLKGAITGSQVAKGVDAVLIDEGHKAVKRDFGDRNYELMYKNLKFAIIFIDDDQMINKKGISADEVEKVAKEFGHKVYKENIEEIFRYKGERSFVDWISTIIYGREIISGDIAYKQNVYVNKTSKYKLNNFNSEEEFINAYLSKFDQTDTKTRIIRMWDVPWYFGDSDQGEMPKSIMMGGYGFAWNPNPTWLKKMREKYRTSYDTYSKELCAYARKPRSFLADNFNEKFYVGYYKHLHGYEVDNIFVYIPKIYGYENGKIIFRQHEVAIDIKDEFWAPNSDSAEKRSVEWQKTNHTIALNRLKVALTRGTKSTNIYIEDDALREYINSTIK